MSDKDVHDASAQPLIVPDDRGRWRPILRIRWSVVLFLVFLAILFIVNRLTPVRPFATLNCDEECSIQRFSSDSSMLVIAEGHQYSYGRPLRVLDVKRGAELVAKTPDDMRIRDIHFSSHAILLAAHEKGEDVVIWNLTTGEERARLPPGAYCRPWSYFRFTPDGQYLELWHWGVGQPDPAAYSWTRSLWNIETQRVELGSDRNITSLIFSPDRRSLVSVSEPESNVQEITLWQLTSSHSLSLVRSQVVSAMNVSVTPTLKQFATVDHDEVVVWNMTTGAKEHSIQVESGRRFRHAWFSKNGTQLDVRSVVPGTWNVGRQATTWDISASPVKLAQSSDKFDWSDRAYESLDGLWRAIPVENGIRLIATNTANTRDLFHDGDQGPPGHYLYLHDWQQEWPDCLFSPDRRLVLVTGLVDPGHGPLFGDVLPSRLSPFRPSSSEAVCRVWNLESGEEVMAFPGCSDAKFSPDGRILATLHKGGVVKLWNFPFRKPLPRILWLSVLIWLSVVLTAWLPKAAFSRSRLWRGRPAYTP